MSSIEYFLNAVAAIVVFSLNVLPATAQMSSVKERGRTIKYPVVKQVSISDKSIIRKQPERIFAPYYYLGNDEKYRPLYDLQAKYNEGAAKIFTLAFIVGKGACDKADWDSEIGLEAPRIQVAALRRTGGDVIVSFGGNVSREKQELTFYCKQQPALKAQYARIIEIFQANHLDFDLEGLSLPSANDVKTDEVMADVERRNKVLAQLQAEALRKGTQLSVSYTLPVGQNGLRKESLWVIENAVKNNVKISYINLMTMYFGQNYPNVGALAVSSVKAAYEQLRTLTRISGKALWQMIGVTPNIGREQNAKEIFSLHDGNKDAETIFNFANNPQTPIGFLSMWAVNRDQPCVPGNPLQNNPQENCHGLSSARNSFAKYFAAFPGKP